MFHTGIPHYLTEDDEYRGLNLPKNTTVIANLWYYPIFYTTLSDGDQLSQGLCVVLKTSTTTRRFSAQSGSWAKASLIP